MVGDKALVSESLIHQLQNLGDRIRGLVMDLAGFCKAKGGVEIARL